MRKIVIVLTTGLMLLFSQGGWPATWYVAPPPLGANGNPGTQELPLPTIQAGIDNAAHGDMVIVAEGSYVENIQFNGKNIILTSTDALDPSVVANTIVDGNQAGSVVAFSGTETEACVLSGFTIRNGNSRLGGGICGGPLDNPTGAAIQNNAITGNSAEVGGGLYSCYGRIQNNTILGNSAEFGGGLYSCHGTIENNTIAGNSAERDAGLSRCDGTVQNNAIIGNSAGLLAGGLSGCHGTIRNNTITGNSAGSYGGGVYSCNAAIQNNTITGNSAGSGGGLYWCSGMIQNCILWANNAATGPQLYGSSFPTFSCIEGWPGGGEGNIALNPQFVDPDGPDNDPATCEDNDYHLLPGSPGVDKGKNDDWMKGAVDLDGNPRILLGATSLTVDMGAYERRFPLGIAWMGPAGIELSWTMRPQTAYTVLSSFDVAAEPWTHETMILGGETGGPAVWLDPATTSPLKFYKIAIE